ncbi:MAG: class I SAM-dependent methyltransferase [Bacteroidota bacterium]
MQLKESIELLQHKNFQPVEKQIWADLGCGSGLFTLALANLLQAGSTVYAVDTNTSALKKLPSNDKVSIRPVQSDFITDQFEFSNLDGILMANSLHYVKDKSAFIGKMIKYLKSGGCFLMVEYDTDKPVSTWVPYPTSFQTLKKIFAAAGFISAQKMNERPSVYNNGKMYSAIFTK